MAYVLETRTVASGAYTHLYKMTAKEFAAARAKGSEGYHVRKVPASVAHQHVRRGGIHSTSLWIDDNNRIRG